MGKDRTQASSVPWSELTAAIQTNPQRGAGLGGPSAAAAVAAIPTETVVTWLPPGWSEDNSFTVADAVSFALWVRDPLYRVAAPTVRRAMEMEEAAALLHNSESAWHTHNGRTRGWVRKHLEEDLRARSSGADPSPDAWEAVRTIKRTAQLVDYICVVRELRFALWSPEQNNVTVIPLTGSAPVVNLNCVSAHVLVGPKTGHLVTPDAWPSMLSETKGFTWTPPACAPSIGTQTVATIQEALDAMQPGQPRTGGRTGLWIRLLWARLENELMGKGKGKGKGNGNMIEDIEFPS